MKNLGNSAIITMARTDAEEQQTIEIAPWQLQPWMQPNSRRILLRRKPLKSSTIALSGQKKKLG
jgi:hypothetical protein